MPWSPIDSNDACHLLLLLFGHIQVAINWFNAFIPSVPLNNHVIRALRHALGNGREFRDELARARLLKDAPQIMSPGRPGQRRPSHDYASTSHVMSPGRPGHRRASNAT